MTILEITAPDRPGLLARIGKIFLDFDLSLQNAKIATLGERVEDVFFITDNHGQPLADPALCQKLQDAIVETAGTIRPGQRPQPPDLLALLFRSLHEPRP